MEKHNKKYNPKGYKILMPDAHALNNNLVAMQRIDGVVSIYQMLGREPKRKAFRELLRKNKISVRRFYLEKAKACLRLGVLPEELPFVGIDKKK